MVRGCDCLVHLPCQQPEGGVWLLGAGRAAQISGHPGTTGHWLHDLCPDGLLCFYDIGTQGVMGEREQHLMDLLLLV